MTSQSRLEITACPGSLTFVGFATVVACVVFVEPVETWSLEHVEAPAFRHPSTCSGPAQCKVGIPFQFYDPYVPKAPAKMRKSPNPIVPLPSRSNRAL